MKNEQSVIVEVNGYQDELVLDESKLDSLRAGHSSYHLLSDVLREIGGVTFVQINGDDRYPSEGGKPWMEVVIRVSPPGLVGCDFCGGSGEYDPGCGERLAECPHCSGSGRAD